MNRGVLLMIASASVAASGPMAEITVGDQLPALRGEFLTGRAAVLPQAASGRVALLMLGFAYDSRFEVEAWAHRFREEFGREPKITFFEIPMISGLATMGKWFIDSGMRRGTPKADRENVITVYRGSDRWKERLGVQDPKAAYLILLDPKGKVAWRYSGSFGDEPYQALSAQVLRLLAGK
jgi:hypothetical protein